VPILTAILSTVVKTATLVEMSVGQSIQAALAHASTVCSDAVHGPRVAVAQAVIVASVVSKNVGKSQLQYHNHVWNRYMV